jgi:SAM-dependent methyltransferase
VLEIGCAYGFFLELIQNDYPGSIGIDVAGEAIAYARSHGLDVHECDLMEIELPGKFDAICLWDTIEHLPFPTLVLEKSRDLLRPGGYLFLTTGDLGALLPRLQGLKWRQIHPPTHLFYFTRKALQQLCVKLNFEVMEIGTVKVSRRIGSALSCLARSRPKSLIASLSLGACRILPSRILNKGISLNLGDTMYLVARRSN